MVLFFALVLELERSPPIAVTGLSLFTSSRRFNRFCVKLLPRPWPKSLTSDSWLGCPSMGGEICESASSLLLAAVFSSGLNWLLGCGKAENCFLLVAKAWRAFEARLLPVSTWSGYIFWTPPFLPWEAILRGRKGDPRLILVTSYSVKPPCHIGGGLFFFKFIIFELRLMSRAYPISLPFGCISLYLAFFI